MGGNTDIKTSQEKRMPPFSKDTKEASLTASHWPCRCRGLSAQVPESLGAQNSARRQPGISLVF